MQIKTIILDLGGVYFTDGTKESIEIISSRYRIEREKVQKVLHGELGALYRRGDIGGNVFWAKAKLFWGINVHSDLLSEIWLQSYKVFEGTETAIKQLYHTGYELLYLSDNVRERVQYLSEKYDFLKWFSAGVFSYEVRTRKPDMVMYQAVLAKSTSFAENCVYIDDCYELLEPAKQLGMHIIHFKNPIQLVDDLKKLGVSTVRQ